MKAIWNNRAFPTPAFASLVAVEPDLPERLSTGHRKSISQLKSFRINIKPIISTEHVNRGP